VALLKIKPETKLEQPTNNVFLQKESNRKRKRGEESLKIQRRDSKFKGKTQSSDYLEYKTKKSIKPRKNKQKP
jgi:hypothetical protein